MRLNWFFRSSTKKTTPVLARIAPTWRLSPWRRIAQSACLLAFLLLFLYVCFPYTAVPKPPVEGAGAEAWPSHYADDLLRKEIAPAELFLTLDPLVGLSTAIASRTWAPSLVFAAAILLMTLIVPRGFCGYVCPLGTILDLFDWAIGRRVGRFRLKGRGWYAHLKYYLLAGVLAASCFGVLLSGFVAAIPILTRAAAYLLTPLETGLARSWRQVPPIHSGQALSLVLFALVLALGFLRRRFWCAYVCPTGAVFSLVSLLRLTERKVEPSCIQCGKCVEHCPFDAIEPDFTTRTIDCTFCQTCGGVCPVTTIQFVPRWSTLVVKPAGDSANQKPQPTRRKFLATAAGIAAGAIGGAAAAGTIQTTATGKSGTTLLYPVRPPGSAPEEAFLALCIRCGECLQACPNDVLQPQGFQQGWKGLWTPHVVADWSGCEPSCNNCGQVCPTGAIRAIPLEEKRVARMALALVNEQTCLPYAGREQCRLCAEVCADSGYHAIEFMAVGAETNEDGVPMEDTGMLAPVVLPEKCVGCGLCQTRCHAINVKTKRLLTASAVVIEAGPGKEDRILSGSYAALREAERKQREAERAKQFESESDGGDYLPDFLK